MVLGRLRAAALEGSRVGAERCHRVQPDSRNLMGEKDLTVKVGSM